MRKSWKVIALGVLATLTFASCGGTSQAPTGSGDAAVEEASSADVVIQAFEFRPQEIQVSAGDTVTWENEDDILHTVTSGKAQEQGVPGVTSNTDAEPDGLFAQDMDGVGASFSFTFADVGQFAYFCAIHPGMTGTVIVN